MDCKHNVPSFSKVALWTHFKLKTVELTVVADLEAHAGATVARGDQQVHVITGANEKMGRLSAMILSD